MSSTAALLAVVTALVAPQAPPAPPPAEQEEKVEAPPPAGEEPSPDAPKADAKPEPEVQAAKDPERKVSLDPQPALPPPPGRLTFDVDPIADGAIIAVALSFGFVVDALAGTGELRPQQIASNFERSQLLAIDRGALSLTPNDAAASRANLGLFLGVGFAVADPILSGIREKSVQTGLADAFMYAESMSLTFALTDIVKVAVRRPRPVAYAEAEENRDDPSYSNRDTDSSLSFFSLHASMTASIGATASYLAFTRSPHTVRPWVTLALATALSTFVSVERVRAGKHFPTDVIAGSVAGAGVGIVVPHLHRTDDIKQRRVWVGFAPANGYEGERGGTLRLNGTF
ncbi:MAG: phosphoesterase PA-phosphatase related protein [Polyangiaceae bacterium]|jgi:undecaprenyl-diphosphatase|nr:phosphoesterase PA-phosphatase related protein [Polyangiaceae bacterium]